MKRKRYCLWHFHAKRKKNVSAQWSFTATVRLTHPALLCCKLTLLMALQSLVTKLLADTKWIACVQNWLLSSRCGGKIFLIDCIGVFVCCRPGDRFLRRTARKPQERQQLRTMKRLWAPRISPWTKHDFSSNLLLQTLAARTSRTKGRSRDGLGC